MSKFIDLTGKQFGKLAVIKRAEDWIQPSGQHKTRWLCQCDCGEYIIVTTSNLRNGHTKSCGCLQKEIMTDTFSKFNTYNLSGDYGIGYTSKNEEFYFDLEDYDKIKDYCWHIDGHGYVTSSKHNQKDKKIRMHVLLLPNVKEIDHKNHKKYDNRKNNLRDVSHSENMMNCSIKSNNTSGITGVNFRRDKNKWEARIIVNKKCIRLGYFDNFTEAVKVRLNTEQRYFGEFSYQPNIKILNYINNGGILEPYNKEQIENIMNEKE